MGWQYTLQELARAIGARPPRGKRTFRSVSTDTRTLQPGDVFFALTGEHFDGHAFVSQAFEHGACAAVTREPTQAGPAFLVPDPLKALQDFAASHRKRYDVALLALTGSCGKTSSRDLAAALLATKYRVAKTQGNLNNEIGCPLSLLQLDETTEIALIEMGANHVGEIRRLCALAHPTESAITVITPAHLEGFGNLENVAKAKAEVVETLPENGTFYVNNDDPWCMRIAESFPGNKVTFGTTGDVVLEECRFDQSGELFVRVAPVGTLRLPLYSRAHATNVLLAIAIGLNHGVEEFEKPLRTACEKPARFKLMKCGSIEIIDDTYNANPASTVAALEALAERPGEGPRIAVFGDMLELGEAAKDLHRGVGERAGELGIDHLFATGAYACYTVEAAKAAGVAHAGALATVRAMLQAIQQAARPGAVILVKGSRAMRMERVVEGLRKQYGAHGTTPEVKSAEL